MVTLFQKLHEHPRMYANVPMFTMSTDTLLFLQLNNTTD